MALSSQLRHVTFPRGSRLPALDHAPSRPRSAELFERELSLDQSSFLRWLFEQGGIDHRAYRTETLLRRLPACLRCLHASSLTEARKILEQSPARVAPAIAAMLVGVTSFFRDADVFEWLEREGLQPIREARQAFYVLSLGCSDGAELSSVAMLLAEQSRLEHTYLLGCDCRPEAIQHARLGVYDPVEVRGVSAERRARFLESAGNGWKLVPEIRRRLRWKVSDVHRGLEPGVWDVILFRNTAMYFHTRSLRSLWSRIESALRPGGVLVLGRAERPFGTTRLTPVRRSVFRKVRG